MHSVKYPGIYNYRDYPTKVLRVVPSVYAQRPVQCSGVLKRSVLRNPGAPPEVIHSELVHVGITGKKVRADGGREVTGGGGNN